MILLKQETVSGSGISWAIMQVCTLLQTDNHANNSVFFTGWMPFLPPNQQHQSTHTHTHNRLTAFVWDNPGRPVPEETLAHSHPT